jgi:UDP-glucose:(heptosyl)LPS alpha-1,3-glucosyltransferase
LIGVVPNGVDTERFHPTNRDLHRDATRRELGLDPVQAMVLFVGNSWSRKGLSTAIEAMREWEGWAPTLVVVGDGSPGPFLEGLPGHVAARIIFVGRRRDDVQRFYAAADVFLLPTLYEPFGLVILEALASGLPAVVSASAGAAEWLVDGEDAILLKDPANAGEVRRALETVLMNGDVARRLSINGRRRAEEMSWGEVSQRLLKVVMNEHSPAEVQGNS